MTASMGIEPIPFPTAALNDVGTVSPQHMFIVMEMKLKNGLFSVWVFGLSSSEMV